MKNQDQHHEELMPEDENIHASHTPNPDRDTTGNWDEKKHMS